MTQQNPYRFVLDDKTEILLNLPDGVFVPTGTTTLLINAVRGYTGKAGKVLDLGSGSGVVGIVLYLIGLIESPLYSSDLSEKAVDCILQNADNHHVPVVAKVGSLFEPWEGEKFDYIVDDISGVADEAARLSPWFENVPCESGVDGTELITQVLHNAAGYLNPRGALFFPVISLSNVNRILDVAHQNFTHVEQLRREEWPLPKEMHKHISTLSRMQEEGHIQFTEKFGMVLWFTDIYVAFNE